MKLKLKLNPKIMLAKLLSLLKVFRRYSTFIFIVSFLVIYSFLVFRINILNRREPTDSAITAKLQSVQRPRIDQSVLNKIQALQDQNVQVQALFKQARDNPFSE